MYMCGFIVYRYINYSYLLLYTWCPRLIEVNIPVVFKDSLPKLNFFQVADILYKLVFFFNISFFIRFRYEHSLRHIDCKGSLIEFSFVINCQVYNCI